MFRRMRSVGAKWFTLAAIGVVMGVGCRDTSGVSIEVVPQPASTDAEAPAKANVPTNSSETLEKATADRLHQPFSQACTTEIHADSGVALPPVYTLTGKNTGLLNEEVQKVWDQIRFKDADGKPQTYLLTLEVSIGERSLGTIEMLMQPEWAPNHVRNFVALTQVGYYDGLRFDRVVRQRVDGESGSELLIVEAGAPTENADPATSHLGYWVLPEFQPDLKHEPGFVGACLMPSEDNAETAACRFYIALTPAPAMDGNFTVFGKVIRGLEIVREISQQPVLHADAGPDQGRFSTPIVIRRAVATPMPVVK